MFDTGWVLPQQLTPLLMRRALSSSQMAPAGTLPHTHTNTFVCVCVRTHFARHSHLVLPPLSPNSRWLSALLAPPPLRQPLPLYFSPHPSWLPPSVPPPTPSLHLWQLLIHVTALQMSQLTSWENSRGGEDRRRLERRERGVSLLPPPLLCTWDGERCFPPPTQATLYEVPYGWTDQFSHCISVTMGFQTFSEQNPPRLVGALVCVLHLALGVNEQGTCPAERPCLQPTRAAYWLLRSGLIGREEPDPGKSIRRKRDISSLVLREERRRGWEGRDGDTDRRKSAIADPCKEELGWGRRRRRQPDNKVMREIMSAL